MKNARLFLQLKEVMKIAWLTSLLPNVLRLPRPRLRHGRRLALLFHPNQTLNLYTLFLALPLAFLPRLPAFLTSSTILFPGSRLRSSPLTWDLTFLFLSQRVRSKARGYLSELRQATSTSLVLLLFLFSG